MAPRTAAATTLALARSRALAGLVALAALLAPRALPAQSAALARPDPDGNDEPAPHEGPGLAPGAYRFERVGRPPLAHSHVCDLRVFADALYLAHAAHPLGTDGATITRYQPPPAGARGPAFTVAFDWNRPGQPRQGGGGGQGFLRVRALDGALVVPDADPPYAGLGLRDGAAEGYLFVSDATGRFAPPRGPRLLPPAPPALDGARGGAMVLPRAYHVLDAIAYRGRWYAATGAVPPRARAWSGPAPAALLVSEPRAPRMTYAVDYPRPYGNGVWRFGFLTRFRGRLYAGLQDYDGREPNDYVVFAPPDGARELAQEHARGVRVSRHGAALTLRWFADAGRLFWVALERDGAARLRVTDDGERWSEVPLPAGAGRPTALARFRGSLLVLAENALVRLDGEGTALTAALVAPTPRTARGGAVFEVNDGFCAAPLAVYRDGLYAGSQRDGALYRLAPAAP